MLIYKAQTNKQGDHMIVIENGNDKKVIPMFSLSYMEILYKSNGDFKKLRIWLNCGDKVDIDEEDKAIWCLNMLARDVPLAKEE